MCLDITTFLNKQESLVSYSNITNTSQVTTIWHSMCNTSYNGLAIRYNRNL